MNVGMQSSCLRLCKMGARRNPWNASVDGGAKKMAAQLEVPGVVKEQATFLDQFASKLNRQNHQDNVRRPMRGEVCSWHDSDEQIVVNRVRFRRQTGKHLLALRLTGFDPNRSSTDRKFKGPNISANR